MANTSDTARIDMIRALPNVALHEIFDYLTLAEQIRFSSCNADFHSFQKEHNRICKKLDLRPHNYSDLLLYDTFQTFQSLEELLLGSNTHDAHCQAFKHVQMPLLKRLNLARSVISRASFNYISQSSFAKTLEEIDISFCHRTSYDDTFCLRDKCTNLKVLRRQPSWMDGKFQTPFSEDEVEVHTYWPDGSFEFTRSTQSSGFVAELYEIGGEEENDGRHVCDKLQYNNFQAPEGWPDWTTTAYRPGVTLLQLDDEIGSTGKTIRSVLVAQFMWGLKPPRTIRPLLEMVKNSIPLGESRHYHAETRELIPQDQVEEARRQSNLLLISRMELVPFDPEMESLMPPKELVTKNMELCGRFVDEDLVQMVDGLEEILHLQLGGHRELDEQEDDDEDDFSAVD